MIDREKVLHGLDSCGNDDGHPDRCGRTACPYRDNGVWCIHKLAHDAGLLIKQLETGGPKFDEAFVYWLGTTSISPDIAQKLGIEPKEKYYDEN